MPAESPRRNPYVGLKPFERDDQLLFFGRERESRDTLSLVISNPLLLLYGGSGTGKTSLINAGLTPLLLEWHFEVIMMGRLRPPVGDVIPSSGNAYVSNAIRGISLGALDPKRPLMQRGAATAWTGQQDVLEQNTAIQQAPSLEATGSLPDYLRYRDRPREEDQTPVPRVLIFDQFEELFSAHHQPWIDHRRQFFDEVRQALKEDEGLRIIFAMREDYLAHLDRYADQVVGGLRARYRLEPLSPDAALQAITKPAESMDRVFAPGTAEKLRDDLLTVQVDSGTGASISARGEFVDPVQLQVVCVNLWDELPAGVTQITDEHLRQHGSVDQALARFYDQAILKAADTVRSDEGQLRTCFQSMFITSVGTRRFAYLEETSTAGVPNEALNELENLHLVTKEWRNNQYWYELNHDRMIGPIVSSNSAFMQPTAARKDQEPSRRANQQLAHADEARAYGRMDEALQFVEGALAIYRNIGDRSGQASALIKQAEIRRTSHSAAEALAVYEQGRAIYEQLGDRRHEGNTLRDMAAVHQQVRQHTAAIGLEHRALTLAKEEGDRQGQASALRDLGKLYQQTGEYQAALEADQEALRLYHDLDDRPAEAHVLSSLSDAYHGLMDLPMSLTHQEQALDIYRRLGDQRGEANTLGYLGMLHYELGNYQQALDAEQEALAIDVKMGDRWGEANTLRDMGVIFRAIGNELDGIAAQQKACDIYDEIGDRSGVAYMLASIAAARYGSSDVAAARELRTGAFNMALSIGDLRQRANALGSIGMVFYKAGDTANALVFHEAALAIDRQLADRWGEANTLRDIARVYVQLRENDRGRNFFGQAQRIYRDIGDVAGARTVQTELDEVPKAQEAEPVAAVGTSRGQNARKQS